MSMKSTNVEAYKACKESEEFMGGRSHMLAALDARSNNAGMISLEVGGNKPPHRVSTELVRKYFYEREAEDAAAQAVRDRRAGRVEAALIVLATAVLTTAGNIIANVFFPPAAG
jgi:hypothetical protein